MTALGNARGEGMGPGGAEHLDGDTMAGMIEQVIVEMNLRSNIEQLRAFEIVAYHVCFGGEQLLMFIGGVGGTGKT